MNIFDRPQIVIEQRQKIKQEKRCTFTIVNIQDTVEHGRLDAEYWVSNILHGERFATLRELGLQVVSGPFGSSLKSESYCQEGIPFVRISDLQDFFVLTNELKYISEENHNRLSSSKLRSGDLILSKVGNTIGIVSMLTSAVGNECNISENNIGIRFWNDTYKINPAFVLVFLNSLTGQKQIQRLISGNAQPKLNVSDVYNLKLPILSPTFQTKIEQTVKKAHELLENSKQAYKAAENLLLDEVFGNWKPTTHKNWHVKMLSEAQSAGRMDAEYFHAKYEDLLAQIKSYKGGWCELGAVCEVKDKGFNPVENKEYQYIELSSIDNSGNVNEFTQDLGQNLPSRARRLVSKNDVIISSVEGSLDKVTLINTDEDNLLCSTGFYVINSTQILPEVLFLLTKSSICHTQFKRGCGGAILSAFAKNHLEKTILPILSQPLQTQIAQLVKQSFEDRTQSKNLLHLAKTAVEKAIEEGEEMGMKELKNAH